MDHDDLLRDLLLLRRRGGLHQQARLDAVPALADALEEITPASDAPTRLSPVERARASLSSFAGRLEEPAATCALLALNLTGDRRGIVRRRQVAGATLDKSPRQLQRLEDQALNLLASQLHDAVIHARRARFLHEARSVDHRNCIAVLAPLTWWPTDYYTELGRAIREAADRERAGVRKDVMILDVPRDVGSRGGEILGDSLLRDICGLISINLNLPESLLDRCADANIPLVSVTHHETHDVCSASILPDHAGFAELVNSTLEKRDVGAAVLLTKELFNPLKQASVDPFRLEKRKIFLDAAERQLLTDRPVAQLDPKVPIRLAESSAQVIEVKDYSLAEGRRAYLTLLLPKNVTTAVIALADIVAIGFTAELLSAGQALSKAGIRLTGFDNTAVSEILNISSVDYNLHRVGRVAYDRLQEAIDHPGAAPIVERVDCTYITRTSSTW